MGHKNFFFNWEKEIASNLLSQGMASPDQADSFPINQKPYMYNIFLVNNPDIPVSLYIFIIEEFFNQSNQQLIESFNTLRSEGYVSYGLFTKEIGENKIACITDIAKNSGYSLKCIMCKEHEYAFKKS